MGSCGIGFIFEKSAPSRLISKNCQHWTRGSTEACARGEFRLRNPFRLFPGSSGFSTSASQFLLDKKVTKDAISQLAGRYHVSISWESLALALRSLNMATNLATFEAREVLRCEHCSLVQFRTNNSLCRRCHKPLEIEEPEPLEPQLAESAPESRSEGINVARAVREIRASRGLSQRQLAERMGVPRTYISKIENGKAIPTLSSLERLAGALVVDMCVLLRDARSRRHSEVRAIMADPFLAEIASMASKLDGLQRAMFLNHVREMASGRVRRLA